MVSANERWRYIATSSLIGWAHTQNDPALSNLQMISMYFVLVRCSVIALPEGVH